MDYISVRWYSCIYIFQVLYYLLLSVFWVYVYLFLCFAGPQFYFLWIFISSVKIDSFVVNICFLWEFTFPVHIFCFCKNLLFLWIFFFLSTLAYCMYIFYFCLSFLILSDFYHFVYRLSVYLLFCVPFILFVLYYSVKLLDFFSEYFSLPLLSFCLRPFFSLFFRYPFGQSFFLSFLFPLLFPLWLLLWLNSLLFHQIKAFRNLSLSQLSISYLNRSNP